ncbi:MAG TPA: type III-B CRISPR-associated protein Cas10/Cmr2 [Herpetosiphon sp.]|uniref:CRISPR-associated protein, Crm2 family n=1 Tax=Herpetosiphon aurantiacus (strain ATCC 23779 / DSM 785 / 114-95) TaxID=316274 RepID=A9AVY9_HERA2|nr:type III-B CRISPR-associated protein Cas10/Cmr2 [Herpetosiphon sp.]ABX03227.1 CRISPR-associated protein, Crm2 family [Herpetosiphon aurantiacus DSM 785]HBW52522.1 type III-B CRISPR-associated protein Cas10/Cmr2 [Herpetosiphon sp.]
MNRSLLLIALGPVQEFIEQARRTRDVWFGSWVLSHLAKKVAQTLPREGLIFPTGDSLPSPEAENSDPSTERISYSNQILVIVPDAQAAITHAKAAFDQEIDQFVNILLKTKQINWLEGLSEEQREQQLIKQLKDLFEFQYVYVDLPDDQHYAQQRKKLYQLYAARKNTRNFGLIDWQQDPQNMKRSDKSSLDGWHTLIANGAKSGENLSAVDLLKRMLKPQDLDQAYPKGLDGFPSTSHMAALAFAEHVNQSTLARQGWERYINNLRSTGYRITEYLPRVQRFDRIALFPSENTNRDFFDGSLVFESRLGEDFANTDLNTVIIKQARGYLEDFITAYAKQRPNPYYAIIAADGDKMGNLIDSISDVQIHRDLSKVVTTFAKDAAQILENDYQAAVIYAGGDDVLALLPLHTLLAATKKISDLFIEYMQPLAEQQAVSTPTLSVGVAIVHHLEALQDSIQLARKAEKLAKKPRNALAIILSKRNGSDKTIVGQWDTEFYQHLTKLVELHCQQTIPDGFIFELDELLKRFDFGLINDRTELQQTLKIIEHETLRILKRKQIQSAGEATFLAADVINLLQNIIGYCSSHSSNSDQADQYLRDFIAMNLVARELANVQALFEKTQPQGVPQL